MAIDELAQPNKTEELAATLGWPAETFARVLGAG